jgi:hypothetical protein
MFMTIAIIIIGLRHYPGGMPTGATCSVVVSAACHQPLPDDKDAYKFPVQWGAVSHPSDIDLGSRTENENNTLPNKARSENIQRIERTEDDDKKFDEDLESLPMKNMTRFEPGHCCFTTARDVEAPIAGGLYA